MDDNDDALCRIGDLARRTGLTVKTIRYYSDRGIVTPAERSPAGYRLYDRDAVNRLNLVRTLRELGLDLTTIRQVVDRELPLHDVAAAHARALDVQIRTLRLRRAVLTAVADRGDGRADAGFVHRLAKVTDDEHRRLMDDFLATVFEGLHTHPACAAVTRSLTPELPDAPTPEQIDAWVELTELLQDPDFCASVQDMARHLAADRAPDDATGLPRVLAEAVRAQVPPAVTASVAPAAPQAATVVDELAAHYAHTLARPDDPHLRRCLTARLESMNDPRRDHYLRLLAVINGRPVPDSLEPALTWTIRALKARTPQ